MAYSKNEILGFDNPYEHLNDGDALAAHQKILDALDHDKKTILAGTIVSNCPPEKLKELGRALNVLGSPMKSSEDTFHAVVFPLHQVKTRVFSLLDPKNPRPHKTLEDSLDLFNEQKIFAVHVLKNHEAAIAKRLAALAPDERNKVEECLKSLSTSAHDKENPFTLIRKAMKANTLSIASNVHSSFANSAKKQEDTESKENATTWSTHLP